MANRLHVFSKFVNSILTFHYCSYSKPRHLSLILLNISSNSSRNMNVVTKKLYSTLPDNKLFCNSVTNGNNDIKNNNRRASRETEIIEDLYQKAVAHLNSLQSNAQVLKLISTKRKNHIQPANATHAETIEYLQRSGFSLEQLDSLNIIHVAGTKGKGSTCAFVESILRQFGLKTGFFSSPHLISVRERIRINGQPLSKMDFTKYFFEVYERLSTTKFELPKVISSFMIANCQFDCLQKDETDMPAYFRFLTCMACHVFFEEKVDVGILEVGIGGTHDSTNIIRKPIVVGITTLGLDHQSILGNTLEEITSQKAGIMKENAPTFTTSTHPAHILNILKQHAIQTKSPLFVSPPLDEFNNCNNIQLGINGQVSKVNAALALQLVNGFLVKCFPHKLNQHWIMGSPFELTKAYVEGLQNCKWDGRFQTLKKKENLIYYLDGAHTIESLNTAKQWFLDSTPDDSTRILIFHVTGDRNIKDHLTPLSTISPTFDQVLFCPLYVESKISDNWSALRADNNPGTKCRQHAEVWASLVGGNHNCRVFNSAQEITCYLEALATSSTNEPQIRNYRVLVTGSLHLVGTFLSILNS